MPWSRYKPSKRSTCGLLLILSALMLLLPKSWSDAAKNSAQLLVPAQHSLRALAHRGTISLTGLDPASDSDRVTRQATLLELGSLVASNKDLEEENRRLRNLRSGLLSANLPLLPAKIVALDIVAWRDAVLVESGSSHGARHHDWVASRLFTNQGHAAGVEAGQIVLARECLLGRIEQVGPYMARVQLFSDIASPRFEVRIGSMADGAFDFVDFPCSVRGLGRGRMIIDDVPNLYVEDEPGKEGDPSDRRIHVGDLVFSAPGRLGLPVPLAIGAVTELQRDPKKRLVTSLVVEPIVPIDQIREVVIIPLVPLDRLPLPD